MSYIDIFSLGMIVILVFAGTRRGIIMEIMDILILMLNFALTFSAYGSLAKFMINTFKWEAKPSYVFAFILFFIIFGTIMYILAFNIDRFAKLETQIKNINSYTGAFIAFLKSWMFLCIIFMYIYSFNLTDDMRSALDSSFFVRQSKKQTSTMMSLAQIVAPKNVYETIIKNAKKNHFSN